ncbi:nuclear mRNA export [Umbelopsis nana]
MEIRGRGRGRGGSPAITSRLSGFNDNTSYSDNNDQNYGNSRGGYRGRGRGGNRGRGQRGGGRGGSNNYEYGGDVNMNATAPGGGNIEVIVSNYPEGTEQQLLEFLKRKSKRQWEPLQTSVLGDGLHLLIQDMNTATSIIRLNGYTFMNMQLAVAQLGSTPAPAPMQSSPMNRQSAPTSSLDTLRQLIHQRWNAEQKFLNLEKMGLDPLYKRVSHASTTDIRPTMFKLAAETLGEVISVSLSSNRLRSLQSIATLAEYMPNLQNLSLQDNNITTFNDLEPLAGKFHHLNELVLNDNPVKTRDLERHGNDVTYRSEITRRFPTIKLLDGAPVAQAIQFDIQAADLEATAQEAPLPARVKAGFFDQDSSRAAAHDFLGRFFQTFDANRAALFNLYDDTALFSVSVNTTFNPHNKQRNKMGGGGFGNSGQPSDWRDISRNLTRNKSLKRRVECLYYGSANIVQLLSSMPATVHDLTRGDDFVTDAWQMSGFNGYPAVLFIKVHGEFRDGTAPNSARYSFDRVFIVGPAGPGSKAQSAGWQYVILSDQWHIRDHSSNKAFQPESETPVPAFGVQQSFPQAQPFAASAAAQPQVFNPGQSQPPFGSPQPFGTPPVQATPQQPFGSSQPFNSPVVQAAPQPQQQFGSTQRFGTPPIQVAPQPQQPFAHSQTFTPPSAHGTPPPPPPPTPQTATPTPPPSERPPGLTDQQHMNVMELKQRTGLNYTFALQCLAENEWNIATAMDSYERLKNINAIPPEAYSS